MAGSRVGDAWSPGLGFLQPNIRIRSLNPQELNIDALTVRLGSLAATGKDPGPKKHLQLDACLAAFC